MPLSVFYVADDGDPAKGTGLVRFAICKERSTIERAVAALAGATIEAALAYAASH